MTAWAAPGRVTLIGDHTDYNAGLSLPFGIDWRTTAKIETSRHPLVEVRSGRFGAEPQRFDLSAVHVAEPPKIVGWAAYPIGMAWALSGLRPGQIGGFVAQIESELPFGAGVSSSAALELAVGCALNDVFDLGLTPDELVRAGQRTENLVLGAPTGLLDQTAVMFAQRDHGLMLDFGNGTRRQIPLGFGAAGVTVLIIDSGSRHQHRVGGYARRRAECAEACAALGVETLRELGTTDLPAIADRLPAMIFARVRHVVTENERTLRASSLAQNGQLAQLGELLTRSHVSMREDYANSTPAIDHAVSAAIAAGALGARMFGGGFGGACLALVAAGEADRIGRAVVEAVTAAGHRVPKIASVGIAGGPARVAQ